MKCIGFFTILGIIIGIELILWIAEPSFIPPVIYDNSMSISAILLGGYWVMSKIVGCND